jgi:L-iditol 2-dehydrogenase
MRALVLREYGKLEIGETPQPEPGAGEVLIRIEACGICGSDVHGYDGSTGRRIPPVVMGHEAAGTIAALGEGAEGFFVGDRVTFDSTVYCGACVFCLRGDVNLCERREVVGVSCGEYRRAGAFADYVVVPQRILYKLPDDLPFAEAAMLEAVSVALHAVHLGGEARQQDTVLVIGAGMIGLLTMQAAKAAGYGRVLITDTDATRLAMATDLGAEETLLAGDDFVAEILRRTDNFGVDTVFEAVGHSQTVATAIDCVRKGGTVVLIGNLAPHVSLPLQKVVTRQIRLQGSAASAGEYFLAMELIRTRAIRVKPLISAVAALEHGPEWFERLHGREPGLMKVVLSPTVSSTVIEDKEVTV